MIEERHTIDLEGVYGIILLTTNLREAEGIGLHCSTSCKASGNGGKHPEFFLEIGEDRSVVLSYWESNRLGGANYFQIPFGDQKNTLQVEIALSPRELRARAFCLSCPQDSTRTSEFRTGGRIPIDESTGFWSGKKSQLHIQVNGLLYGSNGRGGHGFQIHPPIQHYRAPEPNPTVLSQEPHGGGQGGHDDGIPAR